MSGGHRASKASDPGDLVISPELSKYFPFIVECKKQEVLEMWHFLIPEAQWQPSWDEPKWLHQACEAAAIDPMERYPLLIMTRNFLPEFCAFPLTASIPAPYRELSVRGIFQYQGKVWRIELFDYMLCALTLCVKKHIIWKGRSS